MLQEIYESIKIHNQSGECSLKCFHSTLFTEHQPDNVIQKIKNNPVMFVEIMSSPGDLTFSTDPN
ncbi:unnamed protein product [Schistosoma margrebowiei]|uniref:Uncharacterized protein n=1 Tax=Schistosoma margrebowiei TaxID=48269 RepID=A0A3P8FNY0_9TREM|nr:unnamed protein product [Schistosoma margrebowiei]